MPKINRRHFLHRACLACAALAALPLAPARILAATPQAPGIWQEARLLMGTTVTLTVLSATQTKAEEALGKAFAEVERGIALFDRHATHTALGTLNSTGYLHGAPLELLTLLQASQQLGEQTGYIFNPAVQPVVDLFAASRTPQGGFSLHAPSLKEALALAAPGGISLSGGTVRLLRSGMGLTLDGIAKGYIADLASASLSASGLSNHMVDAGGDIRAMGHNELAKPWAIGIENPSNPHSGQLAASISLRNKAIATSGGYERYYDSTKQHTHLVNPYTGASPSLASVSVVAPTAMQADALATTLSLLAPAEGLALLHSYPGTACLILDKNGTTYASPNWG